MDYISIPIIVFASFPEAIIVTLFGIIAIGKVNYIKSSGNLFRIFLVASLAAISTYFIRRSVGNEIENLLISIFIVTILYIVIMRFKFYESIFSTTFGFIIFILTEIICLVLVSAITGIKLNAAYISDTTRILITIPERLVQVSLIIVSIYKNIKIIDLESTAIKRKEYYIQLIVYMVSIGTLVFLAIVMAKMALFDNGDFANSTNTFLLRLNIYLSLFVTIVLTLAVKTTHEFHKNKNALNNSEFLQNLDYISHLINEKKYQEANEAVDSLKSHIVKQ
ncbi:MAG: hypothetical protein N3B21_12195 [Clostridia bacterium]|nr:hypothetical protein [Clostridia bacterium]